MKALIVLSCVLALTSAFAVYPQHIPVIGPHGVPIDTPEVQAARAQHLSALAHANGVPIAYPLGHIYGVPAITHNGLPLDTPEVAAAKAQHFADYAVAAHRNGVAVAPLAHHVVPVAAGPVDTPEVQLAKAQHFAAHAAALSGHHLRKRRGAFYPQHIPVIGPNGVPVETPEVQAAKAHHFAAYAEASARAVGVPIVPAAHAGYAHPDVYAHPYAAPWRYTEPAVIGADGQPVETPEVQLAKAAHFAAHAAVRGHY